MSWFGLGKKKKEEPVQAKDAISSLRDMLMTLEKKEKHLLVKIDQETEIARENATKNKRLALMALKRKKQYEADLEKLHGTMGTLETQMMTIENANVNLEALHVMRAGSAAMKSIHGTMSIENVEDTMDEIREQMDLASEVSNAISSPIGFGMQIDDDELESELLELEQEALDSQLLGVSQPQPSPSLKDVPTKVPTIPVAASPASADEDIEAELEELRASMDL